jgi:exonuclease SbcC
MQILEIDLENVKSYSHARVSFTEGVNAIVGHNGAGKSTILEAIGYALFDSNEYTVAALVREGARTGIIGVTFRSAVDERAYRVERRFGGANAYAIYDIELHGKICDGKVDVLRFIRQHAGVDEGADLETLFRHAIGMPQGTLTAAFLERPAARKQTFDALLQVEEYKVAFDRLLEVRNVLKERRLRLEADLAALAARLEQLPILEENLRIRGAELAESNTQVATVASELTAILAQRRTLESFAAEVDRLTLQEAQLSEQLRGAERHAADARQALAEAEQAAAQVAAHQADHDRHLTAQAQRTELERAARARQTLLTQQAEADKVAALTQGEATQVAAQLAAVAQAEATIVALAAAVTQQSELEQALAAAQADVQRLEEIERQRDRIGKQLRELQQREQTLAAQLAQVAATQAAATGCETALEQLRQEQDQIKSRRAELRAGAEALKEQSKTLADIATAQCPVCEQPLNDQHRRAMLARNEEQLQRLREQDATEKERLRQVEADIQTQGGEAKRLQDLLRTFPRAAEVERVGQTIRELTAELTELTAAQSAAAKAPMRRQEVTAALAALGNPRQERAVATATAQQRAALESQAQAVAQRRAAAAATLAEVAAALVQFATLDADLTANAADLAASLPGYQTVLTQRQQAATVAQRQAAHQAAEEQVAATTAALATAQTALAAAQARFDRPAFEQAVAREQALRTEQGSLHTGIAMLERQQAVEAQAVADLRSQQVKADALQRAQEQIGRQEAVLETMRGVLRQAGPYITQSVIRQVSSQASQIFGELMQDYSRQLQWGEDYGITLDVAGASREFKQLSGGEQMSAALAVRLALVRSMSSIHIAFFDEPTANLDDTRRAALAQQITNVRGFRQLFVISHDDTFEQATQNLVRVRRGPQGSIVECE